MKVTKEFNFCYGHLLPSHPGLCKNLHGHNSKLLVSVTGPIDTESGMVVDFGHLKELVSPVVKELDHSFVAGTDTPAKLVELIWEMGWDSVDVEGPATAENIAYFILGRLMDDERMRLFELVEVVLYETPNSCVTLTWRGV